MDGAIALLEKSNLTTKDIRDYLRRGTTPASDDGAAPAIRKSITPDENRFMERRKQIVDWASKIESGGAQIDINDRLVLNRGPEPLPVLPGPNNNNNGQGAAAGNHNNLLNHLGHPGFAGLIDNEDEERRWVEREEREAAEAIARAVKRYRDDGVPEEDFILVPVPPIRRHGDTVNLTVRRVCFAVLAVVMAFVCIMLQTLPLFTRVTPSDPVFDKLIPELLHVREFTRHAYFCKDLHRNKDSFHNILKGNASSIDCSDGVLHIPAVHVIRYEASQWSPGTDRGMALRPYVNGVNVTWTMPCDTPTNGDQEAASVPISSSADECFRGVHDGWLGPDLVDGAILLGAKMIKAGADHFDIHQDMSILYHHAPHLVVRVHDLLVESGYYDNDIRQLEPVAFRVQVALPMETAGVFEEKSSQYLSKTINRTNYVDWLYTAKRHNADALYALNLPPFPTMKPIRDTCNLMADMDANFSFAVHTSVFLSHGAGVDYEGGAMLFADSLNPGQGRKESPRRRIRKGITVDGSRGRIVVSTGGRENRRCRLPTRRGIRAVLQIWWDYLDDDEMEEEDVVIPNEDGGSDGEVQDDECEAPAAHQGPNDI